MSSCLCFLLVLIISASFPQQVVLLPTTTQEQDSSPDTTTPTYPSVPGPEYLQGKNKTGTVILRGKCNETWQCFGEHTDCRLGICKCELGYLPRMDNSDLCGEASLQHVQVPQTDPTMIGVVIGLVLMSVTLCVVMRLFAKARFQENRTIFNTPNPRLMNASLLKGGKILLRGNSGGQRSRRGSTLSVNSAGLDPEQGPQSSPQPPPAQHEPKVEREQRRKGRPSRQKSMEVGAGGGEGGGGGGEGPSSRPSRNPRQNSVTSNA